MTTGSTGKPPLADPLREPDVEGVPQRPLVEVAAEDALRHRGPPSWLRLAEKPPTTEHPVTEHGRRILEHDHVDGVGAEPAGRVGREVEALLPSRRRVEPGRERDGEVDVRTRAGTARGTRAEEIDRRDRGVARPRIRERANPPVQVVRKRTLREHGAILRPGGTEGNRRLAPP